jgi:hypothetical protein
MILTASVFYVWFVYMLCRALKRGAAQRDRDYPLTEPPTCRK